MIKWSQLAALLVCSTLGLAVSAETESTEPAQAVVEELVFEVSSLDGETVDLGDTIGNGKWTLVMFWQLDCSICRQQEPVISEFHSKYADKNAQVVGVAIDGMKQAAQIREFLDQRDLSYPNYVSDLGIAAFNYQAISQVPFRGTPTYLLFNPEGELRGDNPGPVRLEALENFIATRD